MLYLDNGKIPTNIPTTFLLTLAISYLFVQALDGVQLKHALPDRVIYTLSIPQATSQDSGTYECSVTNEINGEVRVSSVAVTVFGESLSALKHFSK